MSTIHDALKKAQDDMGSLDKSAPKQENPETPKNPETPEKPEIPKPHNPFNAPPPSEQPIEQASNEKPNNHSAKLLIVLLVLLVVTIGAFAFIAKDNLKLPDLSVLSKKHDSKLSHKARPKNISRNGLHFQGIMRINNKNVALINDSIYKVGDNINGTKIENITKNSVTLIDEKGQEKTLKVSNF